MDGLNSHVQHSTVQSQSLRLHPHSRWLKAHPLLPSELNNPIHLLPSQKDSPDFVPSSSSSTIFLPLLSFLPFFFFPLHLFLPNRNIPISTSFTLIPIIYSSSFFFLYYPYSLLMMKRGESSSFIPNYFCHSFQFTSHYTSKH